MRRIAIIAAMPGELKPLVQGWKRMDAGAKIWRWERDGPNAKWIAVCAGIGREAATRAFAEAEKGRALSAALSIGWAGALDANFSRGKVYRMAQVIDAQTGEEFQLVSSERKIRLVTTARVADAVEKRRLAETYPGAVLVDMEAATIARLSSMRGIPVYCFKAVSDGFRERLPDMNPFIDAEGQFQVARFAGSVVWRPQYWRRLTAFAGNSRRAAQELGRTVGEFLHHEDYLIDSRELGDNRESGYVGQGDEQQDF